MTSELKGNPYLCDKQYKSIPTPPLSLFFLIMTCTKGSDHRLIQTDHALIKVESLIYWFHQRVTDGGLLERKATPHYKVKRPIPHY